MELGVRIRSIGYTAGFHMLIHGAFYRLILDGRNLEILCWGGSCHRAGHTFAMFIGRRIGFESTRFSVGSMCDVMKNILAIDPNWISNDHA